jgi:hypothetical protein
MRSDDEHAPQSAEPEAQLDARPVGGKGLGAVPILLSSPSEAFRRLGADPQWLGTFLLVALLIGLASWIQLPQTLEVSREQMEQGMERQGIDEEEITDTVDRFLNPTMILVGGSLVAIFFLFLAGVMLHVIVSLAGPRTTFRHSSAIYWTAGLAAGAGALLKAVLARTAGTIEVSLSPAALFPDLEFGSLPALFLEIFDLFSLLNLWLLVLGVQFVLRTSRGTGWVVGGGFWALLAFARFGIAAVSSLAGRGM